MNEEEINLREFRTEFEHLSDCKLWRSRKRKPTSTQLKEVLELSDTLDQEEVDGIAQLCMKDNDLLPRDKLPFTDVKTFLIPLLSGAIRANKPQYLVPQAHRGECM